MPLKSRMACQSQRRLLPKNLLSIGLLTAIHCNFFPPSSKGRKEGMPRKANQPRRNSTPSVGLVMKRTTLRNDFGKVPVRIISISAPDQRTHLTLPQTPKHRKLNKQPRRPTNSPHQANRSQKTCSATTPRPPSCISQTICQI